MPKATLLQLRTVAMAQVLEHAKEEKVSIRRLETVEEVLKEADVGSVCSAIAHALQHRLHVCSSLFCIPLPCLSCPATHLHVLMQLLALFDSP